jgi:hypothetical protein
VTEPTDPPRPAPLPLSTTRVRSFWPSPRHEALLQAALREPPGLEEALARWSAASALESVDYATLTLLPQLFRNLCRHELEPALRERLKGVYRWSWHRNQLLLQAVSPALAALRRAGIEVIATKGLPLALGVYRDLGARVMGDADLVVRRERAAAAADALASAGWTPEQPLTPAILDAFGAMAFRDARGRAIDLHWHVFPESYDDSPDRAIFERARAIDLGTEAVLGLDPADHLTLILCHGLSWAANTPLHWVADATLLLRQSEGEIDWDRVVGLARSLARIQVARAALRYLVDAHDAPVPAAALAELDRQRAGRGERAAFWFAERSDRAWPWGRAPLVTAIYLRSSRARGRVPGPIDILRFLSARSGCTPREWLRRALVDGGRHVGRFLASPRGELRGRIGT